LGSDFLCAECLLHCFALDGSGFKREHVLGVVFICDIANGLPLEPVVRLQMPYIFMFALLFRSLSVFQFEIGDVLETCPFFDVFYFWFLSVILFEDSLVLGFTFRSLIGATRNGSPLSAILTVSFKHGLLQDFPQFGNGPILVG
jgi:hypothetical protein